jgi:hypothetical protein
MAQCHGAKDGVGFWSEAMALHAGHLESVRLNDGVDRVSSLRPDYV